jgi:hypothetical protein
MKKAKKLSLKQRAKKAGLSIQLVYNRKSAGWSEKKALSVPVGKYTKKSTPVLSKEPKKVAYKVEPKKEQASGSRVKIAYSTVKIPLPVQRFERKRNNKQMYVAIAIGIILLLAITFVTR